MHLPTQWLALGPSLTTCELQGEVNLLDHHSNTHSLVNLRFRGSMFLHHIQQVIEDFSKTTPPQNRTINVNHLNRSTPTSKVYSANN